MATVSFSLITGIAPSSSSVERGARVEVATPLLAVLQRQQHLRDGDVVVLEQFLVGVRQADLAHGRGRLLLLQRQHPIGQAQLAAPEGDGAGRHEDDLLAPAAQSPQVIHQGLQPGAVEPPGLLVDQQRRAHLDHDAARPFQWRTAGTPGLRSRVHAPKL